MSGLRVLSAAFAPVPGPSAHSAAMLSMVDALRGELDLVTVKTEDLPHIKRIGEARMLRVPVGGGSLAQRRERYARAVARQLDAEPYHVVHVLDPWAGCVAADHRRGFSIVYEVSSFPDAEVDDEAEWLAAHERCLAEAERVLVPTAAAAAVLAAYAARVEVVHPTVDVGAFDCTEVPRFGTPRILYLGALSPSRDLDTVLTAIARVAALRPVRALLAGEHDEARRSRTSALIAEAGLAEIVEVRGEPSAKLLPSLITAADVCLAPSAGLAAGGFVELPHPLLEYLACYRPVVAAAVPGVSELMRDEQEGLQYPPGDAAALADAILEVLRDAVLRERLMENGYRRARDHLGAGARRRRLQQIYEALAPGSQVVDPWREGFDGPSPAGDDALTLPPPGEDTDGGGDTAETFGPAVPAGEKTKPRAARVLVSPDDPTPATDTSPGLVVPDTDPGRG